MSLPPGTRLGPYEIASALGAGGMGEVYRARDTRLERTVAIKILPESLSSDREGGILALILVLVVFLVLSSGGKTDAVPSVVGMTQSQASAAIVKAGLQPKIVYEASPTR